MQASLLADRAAGRLRLVRLDAMGPREFLPLPEPPRAVALGPGIRHSSRDMCGHPFGQGLFDSNELR